MATPTTAVTRWEYGVTTHEFDLEMNHRGFIGPRVLRPRITAQQSASLGKVPIEQLLRRRSTKRAGRSGYGRDSFEFTSFSFATAEYGWEAVMDDRELKIYRDILDQEAINRLRAIDAVCAEYEREVAAAVFNTSTWTGSALTTAVGTAWSTWATSTPIRDVNAAITKVQAGGFQPNALVISNPVFRDLINTSEVIDRIKYSNEANPSVVANAVAGLLQLKYVIVAGGLENTANEAAAPSISQIWGRYGMVCKVAETDDPREPCIGRTFMFEGENSPGAAGSQDALAVLVEEYREESSRASVLRARNDRDVEIMYAEAGHLLSGL
jgi:hypothetical protein